MSWLLGRSRGTQAIRAAGAAAVGSVLLTLLGVPELLGLGGVTWLGASVAGGALAGAIGVGWLVRVVTASAVVFVLGVAWFPPIGRVAHRFVRIDSLPRDPVDAVVVLSAAVTGDERLSPVGLDRLLEGVKLTKLGYSRRLVVSRVWTWSGADSVSSDRDQREIVGLVDPELELSIIAPVGSTRLEALALRAMAETRGWRRVIVVTSPVHTRRACASVERTALEVVCRASPDRSAAVWTQATARDRLGAFAQWSYEWFGWLEYRLKGWVGD